MKKSFNIQELLRCKSKHHGTKPRHPLLMESFPKTPRTRSGAFRSYGSHNYKTKQTTCLHSYIDWSRWFAISNPPRICCPSFTFTGKLGPWQIFLQGHILSTAGDALSIHRQSWILRYIVHNTYYMHVSTTGALKIHAPINCHQDILGVLSGEKFKNFK